MFTLTIKTGGAAFRDEYRADSCGDAPLDEEAVEVRRILTTVIRRLGKGYSKGTLMDTNGNAVGEWKYE